MIKTDIVENIYDNRLTAWNKLLGEISFLSPFQRYEWVKNWWENFAEAETKLFIILVSRNSELIGIAPLMYKKNIFPKYYFIQFIGSGYFDYFDFIIKPGEESEVLFQFIKTIDNRFNLYYLQLKNVFELSDTYKKFVNYKSMFKYIVASVQFIGVVPYIELPRFNQPLSLGIKSSLRADITRQERRLKSMGDLIFKECLGVDEARNIVEDFFNLHIKNWESRRGYSVYKLKLRRIFFRNLIDSLFDKSIVNIYYLSIDGKIIAICFSFKINHRFIYYSPAFEPGFAKYSPGKILLSRLINHAIKNQFTEFDFGIGNEPYKMEWPCKKRNLYNVDIFSSEKMLLKLFLKLRIIIIRSYSMMIIPKLRKLRSAVYLWRWINRKRGIFIRFQ